MRFIAPTPRRAVGARPGSGQRAELAEDRGSVTPLVLGMMVCLLVLTAGVTAAGSAFLAGQRLQRLCDGAVAAAVGVVNPNRESSEGVGLSDPVAAANEYLRVRGPDVGAVVSLGVDRISAQCSNEAPITFGALFGFPTIPRIATATSQPIRKQNASGDPGVFDEARVPAGPEGTLI
jgi:hypothetical protein